MCRCHIADFSSQAGTRAKRSRDALRNVNKNDVGIYAVMSEI